MFTVVIAEKEHIDNIHEYGAFLKPLLAGEQVAFCPWDTRAELLIDAVPTLVETVARRTEWRAVVLCDDRGIKNKNPFDLVRCELPQRPVGKPTDEYLEEVRSRKFKAFEEAARLPLTRLMTYFCDSPLTSGGVNRMENEDPEYREYQLETARKEELRSAIIGDQDLVIAKPTEILCVARRTHINQEYDVTTSWTPHTDLQYSRFYDRNMYYDRMRYMVFDILPEDHQNYNFDYIRFLYALLLVARNETPPGSLRPNCVYRLNCENDEGALRRLLVSYDEKLKATDELLLSELDELRNRKRPTLTDQEVASVFCAGITVPVTLDSDFDRSGLYANHKEVGLSTDCPRRESGVWDHTYLTSQKTLHQLLKKPRRALKKATDDMRLMDRVESERIRLMNSFQIEDVEEFIDNAELTMVNIRTSDLYDTDRYKKEMEEEKRRVDSVIETRMTKKATVLLGVIAMVLLLAGFLPLLFNNLGNGKTVSVSLVVILCAAGVLLAAGLICLFCLRMKLVNRMKDYNNVMWGICNDVEDSLLQFSRYLSCACNLMRGYSVVNFYHENDDPLLRELRVREKHRSDIRQLRTELLENFSPYLLDRSFVDETLTEPFRYNYGHAVDFSYPMPYNMGEERQIEFLQKGCLISVPVNFVRSLTVRMEELYD